jgi:hypothetical protein
VPQKYMTGVKKNSTRACQEHDVSFPLKRCGSAIHSLSTQARTSPNSDEALQETVAKVVLLESSSPLYPQEESTRRVRALNINLDNY